MRIGRLRFSAAHRKRVPRRKLYWVFRLRTVGPISTTHLVDLMRGGFRVLQRNAEDFGHTCEIIGVAEKGPLPHGAEALAVLPLAECYRRYGP